MLLACILVIAAVISACVRWRNTFLVHHMSQESEKRRERERERKREEEEKMYRAMRENER